MSCLCVWRYYFSLSLSPKQSFRLSYTSIYLAEFVPGSLSLSLSLPISCIAILAESCLLVASWIKHSVGTQLTSSPHPPPAPLSFQYPACFAIYFIPVQRKMRLDTISGSFTAKQGVQWHSLPCTQSMATEPCRPTPLHCRLKSLVVTATFAQQCQQCMYACFFFFGPSLYYCIVGMFFQNQKKSFVLGSSPPASIKCCPAAHPRIFHELVPARLHTVVLVFHALNIVVEQGWYWCSAPSKNSNREGADCANIVAAGWSLGKHL